jgi:hypothetical protein
VPVPPLLDSLRRYALDGALLRFARRSGLTALCDGPETEHLRTRAPRVVQVAITNACNLAGTFCSRDTAERSAWTADCAFRLLRDLDRAGTLEVAFGGGEPLVFKGFVDLVRRLDEETRLAVSLHEPLAVEITVQARGSNYEPVLATADAELRAILAERAAKKCRRRAIEGRAGVRTPGVGRLARHRRLRGSDRRRRGGTRDGGVTRAGAAVVYGACSPSALARGPPGW